MAGFRRHLRDGIIGGVLIALVAAGMVIQITTDLRSAIIIAVVVWGTLLIGALFPDIDHHASIPRRVCISLSAYGGAALAGGVSLWASYSYVCPGHKLSPLVSTFGFAVILLAFALRPAIASVVDYSIAQLAGSHRGRTHHPAVTLTITAMIAAGLWMYGVNRVLVLIGLGSFWFGTILHWGRDRW